MRNSKTLGIKLNSSQDLYNSIDKFIHNVIINYKTRFVNHITSGYTYNTSTGSNITSTTCSTTCSSTNNSDNPTPKNISKDTPKNISKDTPKDLKNSLNKVNPEEAQIPSNLLDKSKLEQKFAGISTHSENSTGKNDLNLLCKIILISSYVSSIYNINVVSQYNKRYKQVTSVNSVSSNSTSNTFNLKYLMAILQLILILLDIKIKITNQFIYYNVPHSLVVYSRFIYGLLMLY